MATTTLTANVRAETGKGAARKIRQAGDIPAVIYGHNREPQSLVLNARETEKLVRSIPVSSTAIELTVDGTTVRTLIREIQRHPFKRTILHIDFQELVAGETVVVRCPIVYLGTPEGVRLDGGILDQIMHELQIQVDPSNIPNHIDVDITSLKVGKSLHVSDLTVPAGIKIVDDPTTTVCIVQQSKQAADAPADGAAEPELIRKAKPDDK
ncbi:MAG: 50S ribosomal protein L25 [Gemmatimonas sp.]